jgi:phosphoglycolate phosphatase-like HAD superfamily hydrolase
MQIRSNTHHIIFDLDGTLIDSKKEIIKTYQLVFRDIIPTEKPDFDRMNYGSTLKAVLKSVYKNDPDNKIEQAKKLFSSYYDTSSFEDTLLYESVYDTLDLLKKKGHKLYVATNKRQTPALRILHQKNIAHFFSDIMASEMLTGLNLTKEGMIAELKQKNAFVSGFMVGDSAYDILAGNKQNLTTIAVSYGYENKDVFADQNPSYIIDSFKEIAHLL